MAIIDNYSKEELEQIVQQSYSLAEVITKIGYSTNSGNNSATVKNRIKKYNIDTSHFIHQTPTERNIENIFIKDSTASQATLRRWYVKGEYTEYICSICGQQPFWNNKELTLILDHINGENHDDRLENLRWVCPNCNQQLETTGFSKMHAEKVNKIIKKTYCSNCGKELNKQTKGGLCLQCLNEQRGMLPISRDNLKEKIRKESFCNIGKEFNVTDNAIRKWCDKYNLPRTKKEIKHYSDIEWETI